MSDHWESTVTDPFTTIYDQITLNSDITVHTEQFIINTLFYIRLFKKNYKIAEINGQHTCGLRQQAKMILAIAQSFHDSGKKISGARSISPKRKKIGIYGHGETWLSSG
uniref:Uncharacterized protein n=1 Tax=Micrurus lemniscatus lemniscatus TaxID=129467 RepID=A0A2D4HH22_MICLE